MKESKSRYDQLIERVFFDHYTPNAKEVAFDREEFEPVAKRLGIKLPKNLGDIIYSYRYRSKLPDSINELLSKGEEWIIRSIGHGRYTFAMSTIHRIAPNPRLASIKIPDATPEIIRRYSLNDEQAMLAILQYNRLIDIFLGITCYSLQSHLRTTVPTMGQVETDGLYVGVSKPGAQYIVPVQVKGKADDIGIVQIEQDLAVCDAKFEDLQCRPIAAKLMDDDLIALFEFVRSEGEIAIKEEKHYHLVPNEDLSALEVKKYASS
ncbi:MAG TPA: endonuclease [Phycisphaerales bacterium]|nr:endonuclease [Phycisphaerales bacterium]